MKKIGLLTLDSRIYNYGGILQEYALLEVLKRFGDAEIIDYDVSTESNTFSLKRSILNLSFEKILNYFETPQINTYSNSVIANSINERKEQFDCFRRENMRFSCRVDKTTIQKLVQDYSILVCGSDQIWNPDYNIPSFFLPFDSRIKRVIYAASLGKSSLTRRQKKIYGDYINNIDCVSVREESAIKILKPFTTKTMFEVIDPTLLLSKNEWKKFITTRQIEEKYVFCYFLEMNEKKIESVKEYAMRNNLRIVAIPYLHNKADTYTFDESINPINRGPSDFLNLIFYAEVIITDSFHATVFSTIFEKDFWVFGRQSGSYNMNTRIENLLKIVDMEDRLIYPNELSNKKMGIVTINFEILKSKREESMYFLKNSILNDEWGR